MLHRLSKFIGSRIKASHGDIGKIHDVYFADQQWLLRYLVIDTEGWLGGRKVLITPISIDCIAAERRVVQLGLTRQQIEDSPSIDTNKPVSRAQETDLFDHYGYPYYWTGPRFRGIGRYPPNPPSARTPVANAAGKHGQAPIDPHLRSANAVTGYHLQTTDAELGHIQDFLFDEAGWAIRYLVIDTRNWLPGRHVVIPPDWIKEVNWSERTVSVDVTRDAVRAAPEYQAGLNFSTAHEASLYQHYQRLNYWSRIPPS